MDIPQYDLAALEWEYDGGFPTSKACWGLDLEYYLGHELKIRVSLKEFEDILDTFLKLNDIPTELDLPGDDPYWQRLMRYSVEQVLGPKWQEYYAL